MSRVFDLCVRIFSASATCVLLAAAGVGRAAAQNGAPPEGSVVVSGTVYDTVAGRPLRLAVVRVAQTAATVLTDDDGRFLIRVSPGAITLDIRRIGYEPGSIALRADSGVVPCTVYLRPLAVGLAPVVVSAADDLARRIMRRVIARKHAVYAALHDYRYDGYVKLVARDATLPADQPQSLLLISETRTQAYWERPDHYQETIVARRQSRNLAAEQNLVSVGEIVNFTRDRIDLQKYSVVSPIADDALDHYDYRMLDTLSVGGRRVFRLAIAPRSRAEPLFAGMLDVADSSYDVLAIDVGVNDAVRFSFLENLRYRQLLKDMGGGRWMPFEIRFTGEVRLGLPIPGIPAHMVFEHTASLDQFRFDEGERPRNLDEFRVVVGAKADRPDSGAWEAPGRVPLSPAERTGWRRIDSIAMTGPPLGGRLLGGLGGAVRLSTDPDFFHFNRVDGATIGAARSWQEVPGLYVRTKLEYAGASERWAYRFGVRGRLSQALRLWVGAWVYDETARRPTFISRDYNPTYRALLFRLDPHDYYRQRGWTASFETKVVDHTRLELRYRDMRHSSLGVLTDYAVFGGDRLLRPNPAIADGVLRSAWGTFEYDSRPLLEDKGQAFYLQTLTHTRVTLEAEVARFRRWQLEVESHTRTLNLGLTTVTVAVGAATGPVPPQRYFTVDFGMEPLTFQGGGFNTLNETNFTGTRAAMIVFHHDFDRLLFARSGLPLVRDLPLTLSVHGGVFWTDFHGHTPVPGDELLRTARTAYSELGFGVGNLTPFLSPLNVAVHFTWQLSSYPTARWAMGLWFTPP